MNDLFYPRWLMINYFIVYIIVAGNLSCSNPNDGKTILSPDFTGIDTSALPLKPGNFLSLNMDSFSLSGIVLDINSDEGGMWYGICFTNQERDSSLSYHKNAVKLFGRQIPSGVGHPCIDGFDLTYLNEKGITNKIKVEGTLPINFMKTNILGRTPVNDFHSLYRSYIWGKQQREKQQTPCNEEILSPNAVRERYFDLSTIVK